MAPASVCKFWTAPRLKSEARPQFLVHGDAHAGNIFRTDRGSGLIDWQVLQRGTWAIDVAYHLCAVLPVDLAERVTVVR